MKPGAVSPIFRWFGQILDLMFAWYLSEHIIEGYMFLMRNYRPGDKICIFGCVPVHFEYLILRTI
jgi:uncharacterized protein (DUF2235 family)